MSSRSEHYRAKAAECEQKAADARDAHIKEQFLDLARQWREMVALAERQGT